MTGCLSGSVALVTGGGTGIGRAIVDQYVEEGAQVGVLDVSSSAVKELNETYGRDVLAVEGDVTSFEDNENAVENVLDSFGTLDVFVGNAGVFDLNVTLSETPSEKIESAFGELFSVNVMGYLMGAKAAYDPVAEAEGNMIFTASCSSYLPSTGGIFYVPSKHAVVGIIRRLAYEFAPEVRVNGVAPGYAPTSLSGLQALDQGRSQTTADEMQQVHPLENDPEVSDYTGYYVLLASDEYSGPSTGTIIQADNGLAIRGLEP